MLRPLLTPELIQAIVALIPDSWLMTSRRSPTATSIARPMSATCSAAWPNRAPLSRRPWMRAPSSFDYAIVRVVPRVERGEFVNAGVIAVLPHTPLPGRADRARRASPAGCSRHSSTSTEVRATSARYPADLRRRATGRADRRAAAGRSLPLAGRAAQRHDPDFTSPCGAVCRTR